MFAFDHSAVQNTANYSFVGLYALDPTLAQVVCVHETVKQNVDAADYVGVGVGGWGGGGWRFKGCWR